MRKNHQKPGIGVGIMILKNGRVLLGKRHSDPKKADSELHGESTWTMPGGKLNYRETLQDAARREVLEETGLKIDKRKLSIVSVSDDIGNDAHFVTVGYLYKNPKGVPRVKEPEEITEWRWFSLNKLPRPIFSCSQKVLKAYFESSK